MTVDQVKDSYMFRIIKRALMKKYPWIKDVEVDEEDFENYKHNIFINVFVDPSILADENDWTVASWVEPGYDAGSTLGMFFRDRGSFSYINDEVNDFLYNVTNSPAIPEDLRLPSQRNTFAISSFISI